MQLSKCKSKWSEKKGRQKVEDVPTIWFVPVKTEYNNGDLTNSFLLSLNLSIIPDVTIKRTKNDKGKEIMKKEFKNERQVKNNTKTLYSSNTRAYIKWKKYFD